MKLPRQDHLSDLALFTATVAAAAWQDWAAADLVWSLWISSLLVGYAFLAVTLFAGNEAEPGTSPALRLAGAAVGLGFFTVHFGGFHYGHSVFLNHFFPLVPESPIGSPGGRGPAWWGTVIATAVERYWPFLLATALSRRRDFSRSLAKSPDPNETLVRPYRNVVRMHLLIFVFAGLDAAGLSGYAIYPVLFFYFFPVQALKELAGRDEARATG